MTSLQTLLGIELPIIQAPMAGAQGSALAAAVSNAGGLGSLPCAMLGLDAIRNELAAIKSQTLKAGHHPAVAPRVPAQTRRGFVERPFGESRITVDRRVAEEASIVLPCRESEEILYILNRRLASEWRHL
jgi:NAD(P)H-dependent flavin oxidoreductase YrpB (nitropropane dioxygenase family)